MWLHLGFRVDLAIIPLSSSDSSSPEMDTMSQLLSSPPVVAQTRPKGGCQTAMPRRKRRRRSVRTADSTSAMDTRQESVAPSTLDSERINKKSECITKGEPILEAAPPASHGMAQPKCSDCSRTDPLPLGSGRLSPAGHDTPAGKPPAEMNICNTPDNLQIEMSVMLLKMADGSPPAEVKILTDSDILQKELSVMTRSYRKVDGSVCRRPGRESVCFQEECGGPDVRAGCV